MPTSTPVSASATEPGGHAASDRWLAGARARTRLARLWRSRYTIAGLGILGALIVLAVFADQIAPYGPNPIKGTFRFDTDDALEDALPMKPSCADW